jgi:class 3 adenylate cyclase
LGDLFNGDSREIVAAQYRAFLGGQSEGAVWRSVQSCRGGGVDVFECGVTLVGMGGVSKVVDRVAAVFEDRRADQSLERAVGELRQRNDVLLREILPEGVVRRLQEGEGEAEVTCSVPVATVCFVGVNGLEQAQCSSMSPQGMLAFLTGLVKGYDECRLKCRRCHRLRACGDIYGVVGGVLDPEVAPNLVAEEVVGLGLDCLDAAGQYFARGGVGLSACAGVGTGSPMKAAVLGSERPAFDVFGEGVDVALALVGMSQPGTLQIAERTLQLVRGCSDFEIGPLAAAG